MAKPKRRKPMASNRPRTSKSNRVVSRTVTKRFKFSFKNPAFLLVVLAVALLGGYFLFKSFALTNTVTYSGSFTKKHPSASYNVTTTADGTLTAVASYSNTANFAMNVIAASGGSLACTTSGVNPMTLACPVTKGTYAINLSGTPVAKGSGSYTVTISYPVADTVPPAAVVTSPTSGAAIQGLTNIQGTATDNDGISKVEVSIDGGSYVPASLTGTSATNQIWGYLWDTTKVTNASHTLVVKVTDLTGNTNTASATYTVNNVVAPTDTTPSTISISSPTSGSTVSGTATFQGTATDNVGVSKVQYKLDNASIWTLASGTTSWSFSVDTTTLANNASHVVYVQALDAANNSSTSSESVVVANQVMTTTAPNAQGSWVSPEGVHINVNTTGNWTIAFVYNTLKANALDLNVIGPDLTINVQDVYGDQTQAGAALTGTAYSGYKATITLLGNSNAGTSLADRSLAHEYGHAWSIYYYYTKYNADWSPYEKVRWTTSNGSLTLYADSRTNTAYTWQVREIIADDYRLLFGSQAATTEQPSHLNTDIPMPGAVPGLKDWLYNTWR